MNSKWLDTNTFHYARFQDIGNWSISRGKSLKISLCLPTLNEERTIAKEIVIMKSELMTRYPLLDEIIVIDSGSKDRTLEIAAEFGASVYDADHILPDLEKFTGKGETCGSPVCHHRGYYRLPGCRYQNIHHRFAYGLIGPLLTSDTVKYTKGYYDRPIATGSNKIRPTGGGRVTELVIRPLFSLFFPELTQILQPLSGEYAGYRELFEKVPFPIGYGIETSLILDICETGAGCDRQVDLESGSTGTRTPGRWANGLCHHGNLFETD